MLPHLLGKYIWGLSSRVEDVGCNSEKFAKFWISSIQSEQPAAVPYLLCLRPNPVLQDENTQPQTGIKEWRRWNVPPAVHTSTPLNICGIISGVLSGPTQQNWQIFDHKKMFKNTRFHPAAVWHQAALGGCCSCVWFFHMLLSPLFS